MLNTDDPSIRLTQFESRFLEFVRKGFAPHPDYNTYNEALNTANQILTEIPIETEHLLPFLSHYINHESWQCRVGRLLFITSSFPIYYDPKKHFLELEQFWVTVTDSDPRVLRYLAYCVDSIEDGFGTIINRWTEPVSFFAMEGDMVPIPLPLNDDQLRAIDLERLTQIYF